MGYNHTVTEMIAYIIRSLLKDDRRIHISPSGQKTQHGIDKRTTVPLIQLHRDKVMLKLQNAIVLVTISFGAPLRKSSCLHLQFRRKMEQRGGGQ